MTILKNTLGLPLTYELGIDGVAVNYQAINNLEMQLSANQHDVLVLTHSGIHPKAVTDYVSAPIRLTMLTGPGYSQTFTGTIEKIEPVSKTSQGLINGSPFQTAQIVCLGASYQMRGKKSRVWHSATLAEVAVTLAKQYRLSVDVPNDPLIMANMIQANESDWQFLVRYANALGYVVTCHGTHLHIFDPHKARDRQTSLHTLVTSKTMTGTPVPGVVMKFDGKFQRQQADGEHMDKVVSVLYENGVSFDVRTSEVLGKDAPAKLEDRVGEEVSTYGEALRLVQQGSLEKYDYCADVTAAGVAGCVPGGMVKLNRFEGEFDGWWYVETVKHNANTSAFTTDLHVVRNRNSQLETGGGVPRFMTPPAPGFVDGQFRATRSYYNVY